VFRPHDYGLVTVDLAAREIEAHAQNRILEAIRCDLRYVRVAQSVTERQRCRQNRRD
jgi:hypothetical protein